MDRSQKSIKLVDITPSIDVKLYDNNTVACDYLTSNKDVRIYYPLNKYSIVIKDIDIEVKKKNTHVIQYSHNVYKNLSWTMQNL